MAIEDMSFLAFSIFNLLQLVSYLPQIVCVARDRNGATAISFSCWSIWIAGAATTTVYATINIWDPWLAGVNAVHTLCCLLVLAITVYKRLSFARWARARAPTPEGSEACDELATDPAAAVGPVSAGRSTGPSFPLGGRLPRDHAPCGHVSGWGLDLIRRELGSRTGPGRGEADPPPFRGTIMGLGEIV